MDAARKRIQRELIELNKLKDLKQCGVMCHAKSADNILELLGTICGPSDSPFEGGVFDVDISVPPMYPFSPPKMKFRTKLWHPNISSVTGAICLDILKDNWTPALSIKTALLSLQALLSTPVPEDPQDHEVASQYLRSFEDWTRTAKHWTAKYASPGGKEDLFKEQMAFLTQMGFPPDKCRSALDRSAGDKNAALEILLSSA